MEQSAHVLAEQSYARCVRAPGFLPRLYELLLASDPRIPPMFAATEFPKQHKLLQHGLGLLLSYGKKPDPELLERIAARHSAGGRDVPPDMYVHFVESLMRAIGEYDPRFNAEIDHAWRAAMGPGLDFMKSRYDG